MGQSSGILSHMTLPASLAEAPMPVTHFRLTSRHFGGNPTLQDAILENTGMTAAALELQQIANLNRLFGPGWFLEVREQLHFSGHGAVTVAAQAAPTVGDALAILCNFIEVRLPIMRARLIQQGATSTLVLEPTGNHGIDIEIWRPVLFICMISIRSLIAAIMAQPTDALQCAFRGPRPDYAEALHTALAAPLGFNAPGDNCIFPTSWLAVPSVFSDAALYASAVATLNAQAAARARPPRALRFRIEQLLAEYPAGRMDAAGCAKALGLSRRTMTRRLADEGTGFRQLLDADLRRRALEMIELGGMTSARIADTLGYQNPTSFHRAMQRWTRPAA
jgi:AraC-like DNA-binding protein